MQESVVNQAAIELLRRLPGVTDTNWRALTAAFESLRDLTEVSLLCGRMLHGSVGFYKGLGACEGSNEEP